MKSRRHLHTCGGTGVSNGLHFQTKAQQSHFHLEKITCVALKLPPLPSGNKILNFVSFQASYVLLQQQHRLPWDFIVRKHLGMGRIFPIIHLLLVHKCCLSWSRGHKKPMCLKSSCRALNKGPAAVNGRDVYRETFWELDSFTCEIGNYHEKWNCSQSLRTTII